VRWIERPEESLSMEEESINLNQKAIVLVMDLCEFGFDMKISLD